MTGAGSHSRWSGCPAAFLGARVAQILAIARTVIVSVRLSEPGTDSSPGKIETSDFHHMIA